MKRTACIGSSELTQWLKKKIDMMKPGDFLPPDRKLAETFSVSMRTVARVMKVFKQNGVLVRIPGKGTSKPSLVPETKSIDDYVQITYASEDTLVKTIKQRIFNGEIKSGEPLPSKKNLQIQFGISCKIISMAFRRLEKDNLVVKIGRRYWVGDFKLLVRDSTNANVWLFTESNDLQRHGVSNILMSMERSLLSSGYRLFLNAFSGFREQFEIWQREKNFPVGICITALYPEHCEDIKSYLLRAVKKYPRAIFPNIVLIGPMTVSCKSPVIKEIAIGTFATVVARSVAEFVTRKKYGRAILFYDSSIDGVRPFYDYLRIFTEARNLNPEFEITFVVHSDDLQETTNTFYQKLTKLYSHDYFSVVLNKYESVSLSHIKSQTFISTISTDPAVKYYKPRLDTIWLFSSDTKAIEASEHCAESRISVPGNIGILSLKDSVQCFQHGITASTLDYSTIGYLCSGALIGNIPVEKTRRGFLRTRAGVIQRMSTR